jgi:MYXO-CTERM domain-containing protein
VLARSSTALPEPDEAADEAAATDALDPLEEVLPGPGAAGCACGAGSGGGGAWGLGLGLGLGLRGRRRRRGRCGR